MPFKFRWPFHWPRRPSAPDTANRSASPGPTATDATTPGAANNSAAPVQRARAEPARPAAAATPPLVSEGPSEPRGIGPGPNLGQELLNRLPAFSTPPTLGRLGGLRAMAQTLPTVERFLQTLPVSPPAPTLPGMGAAAEFAASLPALAGYGEPGAGPRAPAFPAQLEPPSEPTDVLAPPGGMPGQIAGLSGAGAVLEPSRAAPVAPQVTPFLARETAPAPGAAATPPPVQRAIDAAGAPAPAAAPTLASPSVSAAGQRQGILVSPVWTEPRGSITQVLSPEQTLTGNILPPERLSPVQRESAQTLGQDWASPAELVQPAKPTVERISVEQREAIESQRGQGRQLEPETRQRFEQAYGQPLDQVRVHTGPIAHATSASLNAIAFASGSDLFFTQNSYAPDSPQGLSLIGHELAHVIQQQYGVAGDGDALRPADDLYERQADQLAARALETPLAQARATGTPARAGGAVQRSQEDELRLPGSPPSLPAASTWTPGEALRSAGAPGTQAPPLASAPLLGARRPEDEPVQRVAAGNPTVSDSMPSSASRTGSPLAANATGEPLPSLAATPQRIGSLTEQLLSPSVMWSNGVSLSQDLPGLGRVSDAGQGLPVFRRISMPNLSMPSLGSLPNLSHSLPDLGSAHLPDAGALTDQLPAVPGLPSLPSGLPGLGDAAPAMPDLGGLAQSLGGALPTKLGMPGLPSGLAAPGGMTPPEMPLAEGLGAAAGDAMGGAASSAMSAGQQALGSITGMAPSGDAPPAAPALPSLDKLTEHIWKEVQRKLKIERERSRGLA